MSIRKSKMLLSVSAAALLIASYAQGAGFALIENSASGMGSAFASGGAAGEDASTMWFNPASMTLLKGQNMMAGLHYVAPQDDFTNQGSTNADGTPLSGPNSEGGKPAVIPNFYYTGQVTDTLFLGLGINVPFGMGTEYDDDWVGRYHAVKTDLMTININPAIAYRINDQWSIGGGINVQYVDLTLTSAIDFGALAGHPGAADGFADLQADNADDISFGWNIGVLYELSKSTRFSLAYRSSITHDAKGNADFSVPASTGTAAIVSTGAFTDSGIYASVELPASASFSAFHSFNDSFDLMADVLWTQWSVFDELRIKYNNPAQPDSVTTENYQDQWRFALGGRYHVNRDLIFRAGLAYDEKAVPDEQHRTPRIPDNDRTWVSLGMGYQFSEMIGMDLGYAHLFVDDTPIENEYESSQPALNHTLKGEFDASVDIFSAQLTLKF